MLSQDEIMEIVLVLYLHDELRRSFVALVSLNYPTFSELVVQSCSSYFGITSREFFKTLEKKLGNFWEHREMAVSGNAQSDNNRVRTEIPSHECGVKGFFPQTEKIMKKELSYDISSSL